MDGLGVRRKIAIAVLALAGLGISLYLTVVHFTGSELPCPVGNGCDLVLEGEYATALGVPVSAIGVLAYGAILGILWRFILPRYGGILLYGIALAGITFAAYLAYLEAFVVQSACSYCFLSFAIIISIFVALLRPTPVLTGLPWKQYRLISLAVIIVVLAGVLTSYQVAQKTLSAEEQAYALGLAQHLTASQAVMYGTYWCAHCAEQKALFGEAFRAVTYVECDPQGKDAEPARCEGKGVKGYPMWEIGGRMYQGTQTLAALARLSGYQAPSP